MKKNSPSSEKVLWKIAVATSVEAEEAVGELLESTFGRPASSYQDAATGAVTVTVHLETKPEWSAAQRSSLRAGLHRIRERGLSLGPGRISLARVRREDWAQSWKKHFQPLAIGSALLLKPSWSRRRPRRGQAVVVLDPGLSFGTGQHPTTAFCLEELAARRGSGGVRPSPGAASRKRTSAFDRLKSGRLYDVAAPGDGRTPCQRGSFLDIGTGSGILAIAAAKLGYRPVEAFDFDPEAVRIARANVRRNRVGHKIRFSEQDVTKLPRTAAKRYSFICANLLADLLMAERDRILARLAPDGVLVIAGILKREFGQVRRVYEAAGLRLLASRAKNEWRSGAFARRKGM